MFMSLNGKHPLRIVRNQVVTATSPDKAFCCRRSAQSYS